MSVLLVPDGLDGERVDVAAARMSGVSRSRISSLIEDGFSSHLDAAGEAFGLDFGPVWARFWSPERVRRF